MLELISRFQTTLSLLKTLLEDLNCRLGSLTIKADYGDGEEIIEKPLYIERDTEKGTVQYPIVAEKYERVNPNVLRGLCSALDIPPSEFGLYLE